MVEEAHHKANQTKEGELMMTAAPYGLALLDANGRILSANRRIREYLVALNGMCAAEVITYLGGYHLSELTGSEAKPYHELVTGNPPGRVFEVMVRPQPSELSLETRILEIREVTLERERQKKALQQERLAALGQMAAGIAHDFNNILSAITGYAELLQMSQDTPPEAKNTVAEIARQGFRAAELVRRILDFSRKSISRKHSMDLVSFCNETARLLQRTIPENIRIRIESEPGDFTIMGDPCQLQQILLNIALNARDAMPDGGRLDIRLSSFDIHHASDAPQPGMPPGRWLLLSVSDSGTGIDPEHLSHIFEPFFTTKAVSKGTGLGLAQVYGLVRQHDGFIEVATKPGEGTSFLIYFPPAKGDRAAAADGLAEGTQVGRGESILLVEDDEAVRQLIENMLENLGYRVLSAENGRKGLEVYKQHSKQISLVLMDWVMPELNGDKLYRALKAFDPGTRILVMTGYPLGVGSRSLLAAAGSGWIQKPLRYAELSGIIRRALECRLPPPSPITATDEPKEAALNIILLEDSALDAELIEQELLQAGLDFSLDRVATREGFVSALEGEPPDLILSDYRLPAFDGLSALRIARKRWPEVPFVFVSGKLGEEMAIETLKRGATDYVLKDRLSRLAPAVRRALAEAVEHRSLQTAEKESRQLFTALKNSHAELQQAYEATIRGWCRALEMRDRITDGHNERVADITLKLAEAFGVGTTEAQHMRRGAMLHDIGTMAIPDAILNKPTPLNRQEWSLIRRHPQFALDLLSPIEYLRPALEIPYNHHERWDGSGYPRALAGEQIPFSARLFAVVDVWDVMRSPRAHRCALCDSEVFDHLSQAAGTLFDPVVVEQFLKLNVPPP
jgi:response regulator RpfG family c-di-GMP phosphodiesterase/signal transduction histidine kinase